MNTKIKRAVISTLLQAKRPDLANAVAQVTVAWDSGDWISEEEETPSRPEEEDYTIVDKPMGKYQVGQVGGKHLGQFAEMDDAVKAVMKQMDREKFWPNCWYISDHGNASIMSIKKKGSGYKYSW